MARLVSFGEFVGPGEKKAAACLEAELPDGWIVICNKEILSASGAVREVDLIVVGRHAVFAVEEKNWHGTLYGNENGWVMPSGESRSSPLGQIEAVCRQLAGRLRARVAGLDAGSHGNPFVHGVVLMSASGVQIKVHDPRKDRVFLLKEASRRFLELDEMQGRRFSIEPFQQKIERELVLLQSRPKLPRRVGDYEVEESLAATGPIRSLRCVHADGSHRVLRLVECPSTLDDEKRKGQESLFRREYEALKRLASHGCAPRVDPFFSWEEGAFWVFPVHPIEGQSLQADHAHGAPGVERIWKILHEAFRSLKQVHAEGIVHRALSPESIFIGTKGRVLFSDFLLARLEGSRTIAPLAEELLPDDPFRAPEEMLDLSLSVAASDLFSLALSLVVWITGHRPEREAKGFDLDLKRWRPNLSKNTLRSLERFFDACLIVDDRKRPSVDRALELIDELGPRGADASENREPSPQEDHVPGTILDEQYEVLERLGAGGTATTYLARDLVLDERFVLKRIRFPELAMQLARTEFRSLHALVHPALPRVYDIRPPSKPFHLKLEFVEGRPLAEAREEYAFQGEACRMLALTLADALVYLEERGWVHRDLSPTNVLVPEGAPEDAHLIDFDLATLRGGTIGTVGTPAYRAPEVEHGAPWTPACDLYSLGVVMFELLTGRLPYRRDDRWRYKDELLPLDSSEVQRCGGALLELLLRAAAGDPKQRIQGAKAFCDALADADG